MSGPPGVLIRITMTSVIRKAFLVNLPWSLWSAVSYGEIPLWHVFSVPIIKLEGPRLGLRRNLPEVSSTDLSLANCFTENSSLYHYLDVVLILVCININTIMRCWLVSLGYTGMIRAHDEWPLFLFSRLADTCRNMIETWHATQTLLVTEVRVWVKTSVVICSYSRVSDVKLYEI